MKGLGRLFFITEYAKMKNREGDTYFSRFCTNNKYDIRIIVIGDRAFGIKRMVRNNDLELPEVCNIFYDKNRLMRIV
jgi:hypothetical protein